MVAVVRSRFYSHAALALGLFVLAAFARTYYLRFLSDLPPLSLLMQVHGFLFTAWVVLFVVQTRLIAAHRVDVHMKLGMGGAVLAAAIVAVGIITAIQVAAVPGLRPSGRTGPQFLIIPLTSILIFGGCVFAAIALRRRAGIHKRLMLLAMVGALGPAVARVVLVFHLREYATYVQLVTVALLMSWCLISDWRRNRVVHPVFAIGGLLLLLSWPMRMALTTSPAWEPIGRWLASLA
jgi:hypothetical protein